MDFAELIQEALATPFEGWDFSCFGNRITDDGELPWDYESLARDRLPRAASLLDLGTGGGELLASLLDPGTGDGEPLAPPHVDAAWDLTAATSALEEAGLKVTWSREAAFTTTFHDIGALVLFLRVISWQVPDFDVRAYDSGLRALHEAMEGGHPLKATAHRFALTATGQ
ncbi:hypothetical protein AB0I81_12785 [Nonomuraea sp. NPDC050404]|uniref:hypothetical protein n=1 Tax=Nonomuraea sp. NPDC050404 TaxID=3155783 RepID=UPI0033FDF03C